MEHKQWGREEILKHHEYYEIKELTINPGKIILSHLHKNHAEHLIIISGKAKITIGSDIQFIQTNQHLYIPTNVKHKIENYTNDKLILNKVQIRKKCEDVID